MLGFKKISLWRACLSLVLSWGLLACQTLPPAHSVNWMLTTEVDEAINLAVAESDYRLYAFSRRAIVVPNAEPHSVADVKLRCGYRLVVELGDTLVIPQTPDDVKAIEQRKKLTTFIKAYNHKMLQLCMP
ncbi:hypothetical protein [Algibacillus agarilyticus]|uniref:hypothetical protein n=1 Tax=Algibacillus agarilyticus TaxID=2234133 RepID=UPI000DCF6592|nr:hypothetical protein [Algibacillus agarilyticus]